MPLSVILFWRPLAALCLGAPQRVLLGVSVVEDKVSVVEQLAPGLPRAGLPRARAPHALHVRVVDAELVVVLEVNSIALLKFQQTFQQTFQQSFYSSVEFPVVLETLLKTLLKSLLRFQQRY